MVEENAKPRSGRKESERETERERAQWWIKSLWNLNEHLPAILPLSLIIHSAFVQLQLSSDNRFPQGFSHTPNQNIREYQEILLPGINAPNHLARFKVPYAPPTPTCSPHPLGQDNPGCSTGYMPLIITEVGKGMEKEEKNKGKQGLCLEDLRGRYWRGEDENFI